MYTIRTSPPTKWDPMYNNYRNGGYSLCINGQPTHPIANVLANCVGYACSRFNEIYNMETRSSGMKFTRLCCNAEDFWTVADSLGLKKGQDPKPGAIMCWEGLGDLAGHVAIVERVDSQTQVLTSESGWGGPYFWNAVRRKGDGNWGTGGAYRFRGFIYNPGVRNYEWRKEWHLYEDGKEVTGWHKVDGKWYFMNSYGAMQTGWLAYNGKWYLLGDTGAMLTGWQKVKDKWYYLNPTDDGKHKEGEMWTGWLKYKDKWYLLSNNGDMLVGWQKVNGKWYYLESSGAMHTGWLDYNGKKYYLDPTNGDMAIGTKVIDGKTYTFDSSGALIQ